MSEIAALRLYNPEHVEPDGYPSAWHHDSWQDDVRQAPIKNIIRALAGHRCERCLHPYSAGNPANSARSQWSPCDKLCSHGVPFRYRTAGEEATWRIAPPSAAGVELYEYGPEGALVQRWEAQAQWRILTVHHLNGVKWDCRWWNLAALCQRCHLSIQGRVLMERVYPLEHSEWFKPHAAGWYAAAYLGEDLTREQTMARLDELLALERIA